MKKRAKIAMLGKLLEAEIMSLEYYRIHAEAIPDEDIAQGIRAILTAEESHAKNLEQRIRDLGGGLPSGLDAALRRGAQMGQESKEKGAGGMLRLELSQEQQAIQDYAHGVAEVDDDMVTLEMLEEQLLDEMRHAKWLKKRLMKLEARE
jgi:bacterioferritin (cytochrome b1)